MRIAFDPAYILKASPYNDTSLLVEAFSRSHGRIGVVARGARGPKSKTRVLLQPFQPVLLSWIEKGDLGSVTGVEAGGAPFVLSGEQVFSGWYLNELLLKLVQRHDPHPVLFDAYAMALEGLIATLERALRLFEKRLLTELGFALDLHDDLDPAAHYRHDAESGAFLEVPADERALPGSALIALRDETLENPSDLRTCRNLLRQALKPLLDGREIVTARVLRELRQIG